MSERYNASLLAKHIENAIDNARKLGIKVVISGNKIVVENTAYLSAPACINASADDPYFKSYIDLPMEEDENISKPIIKKQYHYYKCDGVVKCPCGLSNNNCPLDNKDIKIISVKNNYVTFEKIK